MMQAIKHMCEKCNARVYYNLADRGYTCRYCKTFYPEDYFEKPQTTKKDTQDILFIKCGSCNGSIHFDKLAKDFYCEHCGKHYPMDYFNADYKRALSQIIVEDYKCLCDSCNKPVTVNLADGTYYCAECGTFYALEHFGLFAKSAIDNLLKTSKEDVKCVCPHCNGRIFIDPNIGDFYCKNCGNSTPADYFGVISQKNFDYLANGADLSKLSEDVLPKVYEKADVQVSTEKIIDKNTFEENMSTYPQEDKPVKLFHCKNCGSEMIFNELDQASYCPYCDQAAIALAQEKQMKYRDKIKLSYREEQMLMNKGIIEPDAKTIEERKGTKIFLITYLASFAIVIILMIIFFAMLK